MLAGLQNVTFEFGARTIVEDATWHIQPGERIGLIGYNGTGKSTLLKLLVGEYQPSGGTVERSRTTRSVTCTRTCSVLIRRIPSCKWRWLHLKKCCNWKKRSKNWGKNWKRPATISASLKTLHQYSDKLHELETLGGYNIHHHTEEVLQGLGFANADLTRPYKEFSGGWRMRVLLAKMILQQPDLFCWMSLPTTLTFLLSNGWKNISCITRDAVVIVSHDKYFLNRMVTKIVEVYQQQLHIYTGNYDYYRKGKSDPDRDAAESL